MFEIPDYDADIVSIIQEECRGLQSDTLTESM
jgi:hypothetical protein